MAFNKQACFYAVFVLNLPFVIRLSYALTLADKIPVEAEEKIKHFEKDGAHNAEYDHEAFLGEEAKTFDNLSPEESRRRLGLIIDKIDSDKDGFVTYDELKNWINYTQEKYVRDNVDKTWKSHNPKGKEKIAWAEYSDIVHGVMKDTMNEEELSNNANGLSYRDMYNRDKRRWDTSDLNNDGFLTKSEFFSFLHPEEFPNMRDIIALETLEDMDMDKDGKISLNEFIDDLYQGDDDIKPQWVEAEIENFKQIRDKDGDGFLTGDEIKSIIVPEDHDFGESEARHLIHEADENGDKKLSKDEIIDKYDIFVGSQATDYGEALVRHDEF